MVKADGTSGDVNGRDATNATILTIDQAEKMILQELTLAWLSAAVVFSTTLSRLLIVCSKRFWTAPRSERCADTVDTASAIASIAYVGGLFI